MSKLLDAALNFADRGWRVFPLRTNSKIPITKNGHLNAASDPHQIELWWSDNPDANIGLSLAPSGLVAVDVDSYKDDCEWDTFRNGREFDPQLVLGNTFGDPGSCRSSWVTLMVTLVEAAHELR